MRKQPYKLISYSIGGDQMVQSIDRAMQIIRILVSNPNKPDWSITDIAENIKLPFGTAHRLLSSLIKHGLVMQNPETKYYKLGNTWMEIGLQVLESIDVRDAARPVMEKLALDVEESIYLNIRDDVYGITVEIVNSPLKVRIAETLGTRSPLYIGAPNKVLLAYLRKEERELIFNKLQLPIDQIDALEENISEIQDMGYSISEGERTKGTASVAAPILGFGNMVLASISINTPSFRFTKERLPALIEKVQQAAREISIR